MLKGKTERKALGYLRRLEECARLYEREFGPVARQPTQGLRESDLHRIAEKYVPTKMKHDYMRHYWAHFRDIRLSAKKVVEIGVQTDRSIRMWEEFFPNAQIYGIDIDPECARFSGGRRKVFIGDQMDSEFLTEFIRETGGGFDVVIDDGLHSQKSILTSISELFCSLGKRGIYVIEDIQRSPVVMRFIGHLMEAVNFYVGEKKDWPYLTEFPDGVDWLTRHVEGVSFYRYICFVQKGVNPEENPYLVKR